MMDELSRWYENMTYEEAKSILREKMDNLKMSFIAAGYYLKYIRDHEQFREDGYESIWEFAEDNYGIKKSTASRWMSMNDKFSQGGNSPILAEEFRGFEKSQLQEMLYLNDKQIETVTPDMTVKEIREVRKPAEPARECEERTSPIDRGCITGKNPNGNCVCCGNNGVECCEQCDDDCNSRCGWTDSAVATSQQQEEIAEYVPGKCMHNPELACSLPEEAMRTPGTGEGNCGEVCCWECPKEDCKLRCNASEKRENQEEAIATSQQAEAKPVAGMNPPDEESDPEPEVITEENTEVVDAGGEELTEELYEETSDQSDIDLLSKELDKAKNNLDLMLSCYSEKDIQVRKQRLLVGALAGMLCDLDVVDISEPEQPELPFFRNNDQRKEWLRDYEAWGLWYEDKNIGAKYYKYDFNNGARLIAETYIHPGDKYMPEHESSFLHLVGGPEPPRKSGISKWVRHEKYDRYPSNETELVEFLKYVQKEGK